MKKLPIGIQNFKEIASGGYIYVDKTEYIYNLFNDAKYYFLSRPRRFGKSLLLDTIAEVSKGDKELFKGLWIYNSDYDFEKHPVIRLDMSNIANKDADVLERAIVLALKEYIKAENLDIAEELPSHMFKSLIEALCKKYDQKVVVLIDEYDKPILDHLTDIPVAEDNRQALRSFYGILKSMDPYLTMTFITGVTKFTKTSIFSGLNNLKDITMSEDYANICGIPCDCLEERFGEHLNELSAHDRFKQFDNLKDEILAWYDGYSWDGISRLLNPFALLNFFTDKKFGSYWYSTGSPSFLIEMIKQKPELFAELKNMEINERMLDTFDIRNMEAESLLFQTGYLTVKEVVENRGQLTYILDIPNHEVKDAFNSQVLASLTESGDVAAGRAQIEISRSLENGNLDKMLIMLRRLFASIPYQLHVDAEAYYHSIFYAVMSVLGFDISAELSTARGRIDAVLELDDKVYVMEFKYAKCPPDADVEAKRALFEAELNDAMSQISSRGYHSKYIGGDKRIYKVAVAFLGRDDIEMRVEQG